MIIQFMTLFDTFAAIVMLLLHYADIGWRIPLAFSLYLIGKAYLFWGDIPSLIDGIAGLYIILLILGYSNALTFIFAFYLVSKLLFVL